MIYLLDTDSSSYLIRGSHPKLDARVSRVKPGNLAISVITRAELLFGVERKGNPPKLQALVSRFLMQVPSLTWDEPAAASYATIRTALEKQGNAIGNLDMMIAAHAVATESILITNNQRHFARVPLLQMQNWAVA
jgi:tRNA(fMet)-specific endonuclease VapC